MAQAPARLPEGMRVIVRDWLNANHMVFAQAGRTVLVDSGCRRDAAVTLEKVTEALNGHPWTD